MRKLNKYFNLKDTDGPKWYLLHFTTLVSAFPLSIGGLAYLLKSSQKVRAVCGESRRLNLLNLVSRPLVAA